MTSGAKASSIRKENAVLNLFPAVTVEMVNDNGSACEREEDTNDGYDYAGRNVDGAFAVCIDS